jgi:plasmid rolling circle replication initiator protein Rep
LTIAIKKSSLVLPQTTPLFFMNPPSEMAGLELLRDYSSRDSRWDSSRAATDIVAGYYQDADYDRYAQRVNGCAKRLGYKMVSDHEGNVRLKLASVWLCHVRLCPVCQAARNRVWRKRFFQGIPKLIEAYPTARFIFLTLTVKNCNVQFLRPTLEHMSHAFTKLMKRRSLRGLVLGYARAMEVTKRPNNEAHPHFHVLIAVKSSYFGGDYYVRQDEWAEMWQESLEVDYHPVIDIREVKPNKRAIEGKDAMMGAICETAKYTVKVKDLTGTGTLDDRKWLIELTNQLHGIKQINLSGVFREFIKHGEVKADEILEANDESGLGSQDSDDLLFFNWFHHLKRYARYSD